MINNDKFSPSPLHKKLLVYRFRLCSNLVRSRKVSSLHGQGLAKIGSRGKVH